MVGASVAPLALVAAAAVVLGTNVVAGSCRVGVMVPSTGAVLNCNVTVLASGELDVVLTLPHTTDAHAAKVESASMITDARGLPHASCSIMAIVFNHDN